MINFMNVIICQHLLFCIRKPFQALIMKFVSTKWFSEPIFFFRYGIVTYFSTLKLKKIIIYFLWLGNLCASNIIQAKILSTFWWHQSFQFITKGESAKEKHRWRYITRQQKFLSMLVIHTKRNMYIFIIM